MFHAFGIPADTWAFVVQVAGFAAAFLIGVTGGRNLTVSAIAIGFLADVIGGFVIGGGGPGAFVGLFMLPVFCVVLAHFGRGVWWLGWGRRR